MNEQLADIHSISWGVQSSPLAAVRPDHWLYASEQATKTNPNWDKRGSASGSKSKIYHMQWGLRTHEVPFTFEGTPNALVRALSSVFKKGTTKGDPLAYTEFDDSDEPQYLTVDVHRGEGVTRFIGVQAPDFELDFDANASNVAYPGMGLKSLYSRKVESINGTSITFEASKMHNDPAVGFVANDRVKFTNAAGGSPADTTISSVTDNFTVVVASATGIQVGDVCHLRPQDITRDAEVDTIEWGSSEFYIDSTVEAAEALLPASQQPAEDGTAWKMSFMFGDKDGAKRSGSRDPAKFVRTNSDLTFTLKRWFKTYDMFQKWADKADYGIVCRHYGPYVAAAAPVATTERAVASNIATLTTAAHDMVPGQRITVSGMTDATYNGTFTIIDVPDNTHITYALTHGDEATTADTAGTVTSLPSRTQLRVNMYKAQIDTYSVDWKVGETVLMEVNFITVPDPAHLNAASEPKAFDVALSHEEVGF